MHYITRGYIPCGDMALCNFIQPDKMGHVFLMYQNRMQEFILVEKTFREDPLNFYMPGLCKIAVSNGIANHHVFLQLLQK